MPLEEAKEPKATGLDELSMQMMKTIRMAAGFGPKWITVGQVPKFSGSERMQ